MEEKIFEMTENEYLGMSEDYGGICLACGAYADGCEPDMRNHTCESCNKDEVHGLQEALLMGRIEFIEDDDEDDDEEDDDDEE